VKTKKKKQGRPTKISAALTERVRSLLAKGCDQKTACNLAGVPYSTYNEWKERGQKREEPYATFFSVISRVRDTHKLRLLKIVNDAGEGLLPRHADWKAAAWQLERGWPNEFAPYDRRPLPIEPEQRKPFIVTYPEGALERLLESNARVNEQLRKLPPGTKVGSHPPAPENNGAPEVEHYYNRVTKKIEPIEPLDEIE